MQIWPQPQQWQDRLLRKAAMRDLPESFLGIKEPCFIGPDFCQASIPSSLWRKNKQSDPIDSVKILYHCDSQPGCKSTSNAEGHLCPLLDMRHHWAERPRCPENTPNHWVLAGVSTKHIINPNSELGYGAMELHEGPEYTLAPSCGLCSNSNSQAQLTPGASLALGNMLVGFPSSAFFLYVVVPYKVGFSLKTFQSTEAKLPHARQFKDSGPHPSRHDSLHQLFMCPYTYVFMNVGVYTCKCWFIFLSFLLLFIHTSFFFSFIILSLSFLLSAFLPLFLTLLNLPEAYVTY